MFSFASVPSCRGFYDVHEFFSCTAISARLARDSQCEAHDDHLAEGEEEMKKNKKKEKRAWADLSFRVLCMQSLHLHTYIV